MLEKESLEEFKDWLEFRGAKLMPPKNQGEVIRFLGTKGQVGLVYANKADIVTAMNPLATLAWQAFLVDGPWKVALPVKNRKSLSWKVAALEERDGNECFFCGLELGEEKITVEHILSRVSGGSNHFDNLALAHEICNQLASNLSVVEKVRLRDRLRSE